jgi:hypothetical protein
MKKLIILLSVVIVAVLAVHLFPNNRYVSLLRTQVSNLRNSGASLLSEQKDRRGQIEYAEGQVEKRNGGNDGWRQVEQGELLKRGAELRTLANSRAVVTFEDGSVARLNENSQIKLDSGDDFLKLNLFAGAVYNRVAKDDSRKYVVAVDDFEVVARGTAFGVEKNEENILKVQVVESTVEINNGQEQRIGLVEEGNKAEFSNESTEIETVQITDQDRKEEFMAWNEANDEEYFNKKNKEEKNEEEKVVEEKKEETVKKEEVKKVETKKEVVEKESSNGYASTVKLTAEKDERKIKLKWSISGGDAPMGFKIVNSKDPNPVYPGNDYVYLDDSDLRSYTWGKFDKGKTYHFRVCIYKGGKCGAYSNDIEMKF